MTHDLEKTLWAAADKLSKNMDTALYKHVALGLVFIKYISDSFEELQARLLADNLTSARGMIWVRGRRMILRRRDEC